MENFQRAISQFTDDVVVSIVESNDIKIGRKVRVLSGPFAGTEGIVEGEELDATVPEMRNFYIRYVSNNSFKIQIEANESMLEVIE
jgi:transcription antitermination factor NusG